MKAENKWGVALALLILGATMFVFGLQMGQGQTRRQYRLVCPAQVSVTTDAAQIDTTTGVYGRYIVQADPDNTADIFVGDSTNQPIQLQAADSWSSPGMNSNDIWAKSASGTQNANMCAAVP